MRRRQFGSVRRLRSGRWQARYPTRYGDMAAAPQTFATKADAARWLAMAEADRARGTWVDPTAGKLLLSEYAWAWLRSKARVAPRTREIYELQLRLHVLPPIDDSVPALGTMELGRITPELVRAWYAALAQHRTESVAAKAYARLKQILTQAVDDDRIAKNPCRIEGGASERHAEQRFATLEELYQLASAAPDRYRALILTAGLTGLRQGELFGLRARDVDLLHGTITVRRKRLRLASGEVIEDGPKTDASRRIVALPTPLIAELERHLGTYGQGGADGYVFTSSNETPVERDNFNRRVWGPTTRAVSLGGLRFHDLRHTAGTLAARTGATTKEIMSRLGHSSARAAMIYQHATKDRDRLIADRLATMTEEAGLAPVLPITAKNDPAQRGTNSRSGTPMARRASHGRSS